MKLGVEEDLQGSAKGFWLAKKRRNWLGLVIDQRWDEINQMLKDHP